MSAQYQIFDVRLQLCKPPHFRAAHGGAFGGRVVIGTGKMVEAVGNVENQFRVDAAVVRPFLYGPFDIDDEIAGRAFFAGNRFAAKTDDIGGAVFAEEFAVVLRNPRIVRQQQRDLLPDSVRIGGFQCGGQFSGQPADSRQVDSAFLPVY